MMDERERRNIMTRAIQHFGETAQIDMAVEEMAELTKAICKVKRAQAGAEMGAAVENVVEEIADVQIWLCEQEREAADEVLRIAKEEGGAPDE